MRGRTRIVGLGFCPADAAPCRTELEFAEASARRERDVRVVADQRAVHPPSNDAVARRVVP